MSNHTPVNKGISTAPLRNVQVMLKLANALIHRDANVFGIGVFFGYSGLGKTVASNYVRNATNAHLVECNSYWTRKDFAEKLLKALHVPEPKGTLSKMMDQAYRILGDDPERLLIIDEAGYLVNRGMADLIRDIYRNTSIPIILVGEENFPQNLQQSDRTFNRVLEWGIAEPCDTNEIRILAGLHCPNLSLSDDLIAQIEAETQGRTSRVVTTLIAVTAQARNQGLKEINKELFAGPYANGRAPTRHSAFKRRAK